MTSRRFVLSNNARMALTDLHLIVGIWEGKIPLRLHKFFLQPSHQCRNNLLQLTSEALEFDWFMDYPIFSGVLFRGDL